MKIRIKHIIRVFSILTVLLILYSCSTKRNTFSRRVYHNLTAHYNAYWNANESMDQAIKDLDDMIIDNYSRILPVYRFGNANQAKSIQPHLDRVMEKSSFVIQKHSMKFQSKEHVKWIDDSYMLMGKAYFYAKDFVSARRTFSFIQDEYPENPIRFNAKMWLIKTHIEADEFERSKALLKEFETNFDEIEIPYQIQKQYYQLYAHHLLESGSNTDAIPYLEKAIETTSDRNLGTRLRFILAQINQQLENKDRANSLFKEVMRRNPEYRMEFQARLHIAKVFNPETDNYSNHISNLEKMLRDDKNKEYKDQIYDAMAEVARLAKNKTDEINYLKQAVAFAKVDRQQKVRSALKLADLYFEMDRYNDASLYYDTVQQFIPEDFPSYHSIIRRTNLLKQLTDNYKEIHMQDSLQVLALMDESERRTKLEAIIEKQKVEQKQSAVETSTRSAFMNQNELSNNNTSQRGAWYFYNPSNISYGYSEFQRKWGDRKLEDNWRLLNKRMQNVEEILGEGEEEIENDTVAAEVNPGAGLLDKLMADIPLTPEAIEKSDEKIINAYYENALIYEDGLKREELAIETFEILIDRFPGNQHSLNIYYHLYQLYTRLGDELSANRYKDLITTDFSESTYANVVQQSGRIMSTNSMNAEMSALYSTAYNAYENSQYFTTIELCKQGLSESNDPSLLPRFEFLKALSIGKVEVVDSLRVNLENIVLKYPEHELGIRAQEILSILEEKALEESDKESIAEEIVEEEEEVFTYNEASSHNYILMIESGSVNLEALKLRLAGFNNRFPSKTELTVNEIKFDETYDLILIARFEDVLQAKKYLDQAQRDSEIMKAVIGNNEAFIISGENYVEFFRTKNLADYLKFYERYYQ